MNDETIENFILLVEALTSMRVKRTADPFDNLCSAKIALADKISETMHTCECPCHYCTGGGCEPFKQLWRAAGIMQERIIRQ